MAAVIRNVPNGETGVDDGELVAFEAQVLFHARNIGIGQVTSIQLPPLVS